MSSAIPGRRTGRDRMLKPADYILIFLVLAGGITFPFIYAPGTSVPAGAAVSVTVDRDMRYTGPLQQDTLLSVQGGAGISQVIVRDGRVSFAGSVCRDKLCIRSGTIDRAGQWLLCLPNRVLIQIRARTPERGPDGIVH